MDGGGVPGAEGAEGALWLPEVIWYRDGVCHASESDPLTWAHRPVKVRDSRSRVV